MSMDERSLAERLPVEIISNILQNLSISDIRTARLVNSKWYRASRNLVIQKRQKFVLSGLIFENQLRPVFDVIETAGYRHYNLEFHDEDFHLCLNEFLAFIESNSSYIRSLKFLKCSFPFLVLEKITVSCASLEKLIFKKCLCTDSEKTTLMKSSEKKVVHESLTYLEVNQCYNWFEESILEYFLDVYPNIKTFSSKGYCVKFTSNTHRNPAHGKPLFLCHPIEDCLYDEFFQELASFPWIKLEELWIYDMYYNYVAHTASDIETVLINQDQLKSLNVSHCERFHLDALDAVLHLFPNLERFKFSVSYNYSIFEESRREEILQLLAESKLKVLEIAYFLWFSQDGVRFPKSRRNHDMRFLDFHGFGKGLGKPINDIFLIPMLDTFRDLTYLDLSKIDVRGSSKDVVKIIFQDHTKLEYLKLNYCRWISDHAFKKNNMRRLKHLELANTRITEAAIRQFDFPVLKFICLQGCWALSEKGMVLLSVKCPLLRYVDFSNTRISENTVLDIFKNLKFLHCLNIAKRKKHLVALNVEKISHNCLSLRFIEMGKRVPYFGEALTGYSELRGDFYAYNYFKKSWNKCITYYPRCFHCSLPKRQLMKLNS